MTRIGYHPGTHLQNNVTQFLERHLARDAAQVALSWVDPQAMRSWGFDPATELPHLSVTMERFCGDIARTAAGMTELGLQKGDRAILFVPMSLELYTAMFALVRIGAIPVFLDSWARRGHLGVSARCVEPKAMISFQGAFQLVGGVPELAEIPIKIAVGPTTMAFSGRIEELRETPRMAPIEPVEQEHTALVTFTTGSSGEPKGANRTHRFLAAQHYALDECLPYTIRDIDLPAFPIFSLNNIASGVTTVIPAVDLGAPKKNDALILYAQLVSAKATCTTLSPSMLNGISAYCIEQGLKLGGLRRVVTGGAPVSRDNLVDFTKIAPNAEVWVLYGSTEVEPMAHIEAQEMINFRSREADDPEWVDNGVNVGHFADGLRHRFIQIRKGPVMIRSEVDWEDLEVGPGEVGELIVCGEHVCRDYYNNTEAFRRAKIVDEAGDVWHRTGDLARLDEQGNLWMVGRVHNAINRAGHYEFPVRAEVVMKKLPFVKQCAYLGLHHAELGEETCCAVVAHPNAPSVEGMEAEVRRIMAKNGIVVDRVVFPLEIPMDARHHSKVEYDLLREQLVAQGLVG
ncbi:MAG: AMP-binding protein [Myxococcales bacterium]|nr:AMP-binding protein [Myxococcales bacterium]